MKENKPEEIINALLISSFDSIKDESLDIDLSACATIPSTSNNCSLVPEFWVLEAESLNDSVSSELRKSRNKCSQPKITTTINDNSIYENRNIGYSDIPFKYKCEVCCILFHNLEDFSAHNNTHITFKCDACNKEFLNESSLKKHAKCHKTISKKDSVMECPDCGKLLKLSSMWMHRKIHNNNKRYCCDICGQKFVQKINLTHHTKVHTGEKPFECPQCKKAFPERSHLLRHQRYHSLTRPYKCEKCGKMYKTERCLKVHNLVHLEQRPFVCNECNKSFISSSKLKQHVNIHTGDRPFKCNYCARDFTNFPNWLKHTRRRHKVDHKTGELLEKYMDKSISTVKPENEVVMPEVNVVNVHTTSVTSAEDLIMEQALEMQESGLLMSENNEHFIKETIGMNAPDHLIKTNSVKKKYDFENEFDLQFNPSLSSPIYGFQSYTALTSTTATLPSVETLFSFNHQKNLPGP